VSTGSSVDGETEGASLVVSGSGSVVSGLVVADGVALGVTVGVVGGGVTGGCATGGGVGAVAVGVGVVGAGGGATVSEGGAVTTLEVVVPPSGDSDEQANERRSAEQ